MSTRIESAEHCIIVNGVLYPKGVLRACIEGNLLNVWEDLERTIPLVNSVPYNEIIHVNTGSPFASSSALNDFVKEHFFFKRIKNLSELINDVGYLTSETDPTVPGHVKSITTTHISQWNTAYGWGNHAGLYPLLSGSYDNPTWINSLAWSKITGKPTSLSGYGITDAYTQTQIQNYFAGTSAISGYNKADWDAAYVFTSGFDTTDWIQNQSSTIQTAVARISGQLEAGQGRFTGWNSFGVGGAVEVGYDAATGFIIAYDRSSSSYRPLILQGGSGTGANSYLTLHQTAIESNALIDILNVAQDAKIRFNRTGGKIYSVEHDTAQIYLYNQTDAVVTQRWLNSGQVAFDYYAGTGNRITYFDQYGLLIRGAIDPSTIWTSVNDGPNSGLNADMLWSYQPSFTDETNTVVLRNGSGHIFATFFNMTNTSVSGSPMKSIIGKQDFLGDDYLYEFNATTVKDFLGLTNAPTAMPTLQQVATAGNTFTGTLTLQGTTFGNSTINSTGALSILNSGAAQQILTGGMLTSDNYVDASSIPAHGIYSKGVIKTSNGSAFAIGDLGQLYYRGTSNLGLELIQSNDATRSGYDMFFNNYSSSGYQGGWRFGNSSVNAGVFHISFAGVLQAHNYSGNGTKLLQADNNGTFTVSSLDPSIVWTSDNDGAGSGLDADLLDGLNGNHYHQRNPGTSLTNASDANINTTWFDYDYAGISGMAGSVASFGGFAGNYQTELFGRYNAGGNDFYLRTKNDDGGQGWNPTRRVWTDGDYAVDVNPTASTVAKRNAAGYLHAVYYEMTSNSIASTANIRSIIGKNATLGDNYLYEWDAAAVKGFLGLSAAPTTMPSLQDVTSIGSTTTTSITANKLTSATDLRLGDQHFTVAHYNFPSGYFIQTDIPTSSDIMFELFVEGNSYFQNEPISTQLQGYNYPTSGGIYTSVLKARAAGALFEISVFHYGGYVCFWMPAVGSFPTYRFRLATGVLSGFSITSVANSAIPSSGVTQLNVVTPIQMWNQQSLTALGTAAGDLNTMSPNGGFTSNYYGDYTNGTSGFTYGGHIRWYGAGNNQLELQYDINHGGVVSGNVSFRTTNSSGIGSWKIVADRDWVSSQISGAYVPYTGATTNVDLNSRSLVATGIASRNLFVAGEAGIANGNIWINRSSDGGTITDITTDGSYSITNNIQGSGHLWKVSSLDRMQLSGGGSLSVSGPGSAYSFVDRADNNKGWILYADNDLGRLATSNGLLVSWDFYTGAQVNYYHNRNQYGTHALSGNSYAEGNYEAAVTNAAYTAGARAGYGFHNEGVVGLYLHATNDHKLRTRQGTGTYTIAYEDWVTSQFSALTWADILSNNPQSNGNIPHIIGTDYSDTRILFTNPALDNPFELVAGHHNDASDEGFSLYDQINDATRFWFNSSGETYLNDNTIYLPNIVNGSGNFVTWNNGSLRYRNAAQVLSDIGAQAQLNGTGFVKVSGTTVSYDNTAYTPQANVSGTTDFIPKFTSANVLGNPAGQYRLGGWLNLDRYSNTAAGISFYGGPGGAHNTWQLYMAQAGQTSTGIQGNITAPTGTYVTSWALRSLTENGGGYGWTWESMVNGGAAPAIAAELSQDGNFLTGTLKITKFLPESVQEGAIIVDRTIPNGSGNENARGFKDNTTFARNGYAYASYDAVAHFASGGTYPHYTAFQMRPTIQGSVNSVEFGATYFESSVPISRFIGLLHEPPQMYGNTLTDSYAVKVEPFGSVGINNWVIYSSDPNIHSYHGGDFTAGYFNQSSSDSENSPVDQIITTTGSGDNYFRKVDKAHFISELGITPYWSYGSHNLIHPDNPDVTIEGVNFDNHRIHLEAATKINTGGTHYSLLATDNIIINVDSSNLNVWLPNPGDDGQRGRQLKFRQLNTQSEIYFFDADGIRTYLYDYFDGTTHWGIHRLVNAGNSGGVGVGYEWVEIISMDMTSVEKGWQWVIVQQGGSLEFSTDRDPI